MLVYLKTCGWGTGDNQGVPGRRSAFQNQDKNNSPVVQFYILCELRVYILQGFH